MLSTVSPARYSQFGAASNMGMKPYSAPELAADPFWARYGIEDLVTGNTLDNPDEADFEPYPYHSIWSKLFGGSGSSQKSSSKSSSALSSSTPWYTPAGKIGGYGMPPATAYTPASQMTLADFMPAGRSGKLPVKSHHPSTTPYGLGETVKAFAPWAIAALAMSQASGSTASKLLTGAKVLLAGLVLRKLLT